MKVTKVMLVAICIFVLSVGVTSSVMAQEGEEEKAQAFEVTNLKVEPAKVSLGQTVTIKADITNTGGSEGTFTAVLKINNKEESSKDVTLVLNETKTVKFIYTPLEAGTYSFAIAGGPSGSFEAVMIGKPKFRVGPTVYLRPLSDVVKANQDGLVELYMDNPSLNDVTLKVDLRVHVPSGLRVYGQGFGLGGAAGTLYGKLEIPPGTARTVHMNIKAEPIAVGRDFFVHFSGIYYPEGNEDLYNPMSLTHPLKVIEPSPNPKDPEVTQGIEEENKGGGGFGCSPAKAITTPAKGELLLGTGIFAFVFAGLPLYWLVRKRNGNS